MALRPWSERVRRKMRHLAGSKKEQQQQLGFEVAPTRAKHVELTQDTQGYELEFWVSEGASGALGYTLAPTCACSAVSPSPPITYHLPSHLGIMCTASAGSWPSSRPRTTS